MKHPHHYSLAGALVAAILSTTAFANVIVDKGALGKYERQGRFLKPIMSPPTHTSKRDPAPLINNGTVGMDKGELGHYVRHGRFVRPVVDNVDNSWSSTDRPRYFPMEKPRSKVRLGLPHR